MLEIMRGARAGLGGQVDLYRKKAAEIRLERYCGNESLRRGGLAKIKIHLHLYRKGCRIWKCLSTNNYLGHSLKSASSEGYSLDLDVLRFMSG